MNEMDRRSAELSGHMMAIEFVPTAILARLNPAAKILDAAINGIAVAEAKMRAESPESEAAFTIAMCEAARNALDNIRFESGVARRR